MPAKKKAEKEALLAAEEAALPSKPKAAPKAGSKKKETPVAKPGGLNNFSINDPLNLRSGRDEEPVEEFGATGVEGMLEALEVVNQKTDKQAMGAKVRERERWDHCQKHGVLRSDDCVVLCLGQG
jgi:hypothetical protein